jgi:hypothetical protein
MIETNQPESAFPSTFKSMSPEEGQVHRWGMQLRDYFAAKAMQGLIGCPDWREGAGEDVGMNPSDYTARTAYMMADAMLKAREAS